MKNKNLYTLIVLIVLTIITAIISKTLGNVSYFAFAILGLSAIKFILVSFQFMEMKKANFFWKVLIVIYLVVFVGVVTILLN